MFYSHYRQVDNKFAFEFIYCAVATNFRLYGRRQRWLQNNRLLLVEFRPRERNSISAGQSFVSVLNRVEFLIKGLNDSSIGAPSESVPESIRWNLGDQREHIRRRVTRLVGMAVGDVMGRHFPGRRGSLKL